MDKLQELENLVQSIDSPEKYRILELVEMIKRERDFRVTVLSEIREILGTLRVDVKYLQFDLESTRKERDVALGK